MSSDLSVSPETFEYETNYIFIRSGKQAVDIKCATNGLLLSLVLSIERVKNVFNNTSNHNVQRGKCDTTRRPNISKKQTVHITKTKSQSVTSLKATSEDLVE